MADGIDRRKGWQRSCGLEHQRETVRVQNVSGGHFSRCRRGGVALGAQERQIHHAAARVGNLKDTAYIGIESRPREHVSRILLGRDWDLKALICSRGPCLAHGQEIGSKHHARGERCQCA